MKLSDNKKAFLLMLSFLILFIAPILYTIDKAIVNKAKKQIELRKKAKEENLKILSFQGKIYTIKN